MDVQLLPISGALRITPATFPDARGYFKETYSRDRYRAAGVSEEFVQENVSVSHRLVLRGLHCAPGMAKLVQVLRGSAYDVVVDVRRDSSTFLKWHGVVLSEREHTQLYIPSGCLHGFLALEDATTLAYKQSATYDPAVEVGVRWDDPDILIDWPLGGSDPVLSAKDSANPSLRDLGML